MAEELHVHGHLSPHAVGFDTVVAAYKVHCSKRGKCRAERMARNNNVVTACTIVCKLFQHGGQLWTDRLVRIVEPFVHKHARCATHGQRKVGSSECIQVADPANTRVCMACK